MSIPLPTFADIQAAAGRLKGVAIRTPLLENDRVNRKLGGRLFIKPECLQRTGSFKIRGAYNRISTLDADEVVAASAGNHGQAVAWAAREIGARARVFMPQDAPMAKVEATRNYGAAVVLTGTQRPPFTTHRNDSLEPWCLVLLKLIGGDPKMSCQSWMLSMPATKLSVVRSLPAFCKASTTSCAAV